MTKKFLLLTTLLCSYSNICYAKLTDNSASCESLGYTVDYSECIAKNTVPLVCPFATATNKKTLCVTNSCRGYPLKEEDFDKIASDGNSVVYHIKDSEGVFVPKQKDSHGVLGCLAAYEKDGDGNLNEVWYYRIKECKSGSMFVNGLCDKGCDRANVYPYAQHPGNFAGEVIDCIDEEGKAFGYEECHEGWTLKKGQCILNTCNIKDYPYMSDPNTIENRGITKACQIGKNFYYRYSETDDEGSQSEETCGGKGYTYVNGLCLDKCKLMDCSSTDETVSYTKGENTYTKTYHEWSCKQETAYCREGDYAVINGVTVGIITHMPDSEYNKMLIVASDVNLNKKWGDGDATSIDTPMPNLSNVNARKDYNGKKNTNLVLNFKQSDPVNLSYPALEYTAAYSSPSCAHDICRAGEWYLPSLGELTYFYDNRYILLKTTKFIIDITWSSNEASAGSAWRLRPDVGIRDSVTKQEGRRTIPVISVTLK